MSKDIFNPVKKVYSDMLNIELTHWWYRGLEDLVTQQIKKLPINKILDCGCGTGKNLSKFKSLGFEVDGFDISEEALKICNNKKLLHVKKGSVTQIPFKNSEYDLITCFDLLSAIKKDDLETAFSEFARVLKKDGFIIINEAAIPWAVSKHFKEWDLKQRFYLFQLEKYLLKNNFKIIKSSYRVFFLFPLILISRFLENLNTNNNVSDVYKNNKFLNFIFYKIMRLENFLLNYKNLPIGNSVFIIAQKN